MSSEAATVALTFHLLYRTYLCASLELQQAPSQPAPPCAVSSLWGSTSLGFCTCQLSFGGVDWLHCNSWKDQPNHSKKQQKNTHYKQCKRRMLRCFARVCLHDVWGMERGGEQSEKLCKGPSFARTKQLDRRALLRLWRVGCSFTMLFLTAWVWILGCVLMMLGERRELASGNRGALAEHSAAR